MYVNSAYTDVPLQPNNPTNEERDFLTYYALVERKRPNDFYFIKNLTSPPPEITTIAAPGEGRGVKIGIIGGGLAGLASAFELRKLGFDITIFEANDERIGGRVYTYYFDEAKTQYGEFGAARIPVSHETLWHYINLFGLNTRTFVQYNKNSLVYLRDTRARYTDASIMKNIYPRFNLTEWERDTTPERLLFRGYDSQMLKAIPQVRAEILQVKPQYSPETLYWDSRNIRQMLGIAGLSQEAINLVSYLSPLSGNSLYNGYIDFIQENYTADLSFLYELVGGMVNLPLAFYKSFFSSDTGVYGNIPREYLGNVEWKGGNWVTGISMNYDNNKVSLSYDNKTIKGVRCKEFDYVICAIPFSTLRTVTIDPLFRPEKMQAIKEVNYINMSKSLVLCNRRFWEEGDYNEQIVGGISYTDLPITTVWYPSDHAQYSRRMIYDNPNSYYIPRPISYRLSRKPGVLTIYNYNLDATRLANLTHDMRFNEIKREIEEVHGLEYGTLEEIATELKTVNWNNEKWFRGALAFYTPEQKRLFSYVSAAPEYNNKVFFAGEHISPKHRWMQGALKSGMEAANQLALSCINEF